jgi:hypothetical protein
LTRCSRRSAASRVLGLRSSIMKRVCDVQLRNG